MTASQNLNSLARSSVRPVLLRVGRGRVGQRLLRFYADSGLVDAVLAQPASSRKGTTRRIDLLDAAPTELTPDERWFLYALVRGTRPQRVLEIGTSRGGSALVITSAMEDNGVGELWSVDPDPRIELAPELYQGRLHSVTGYSPEAVDELAATVDGPFDLFFIDGLHSHDQVVKDIEACLAQASDDAYILLHDAFHYGVGEAIRKALDANTRLHDAGYVCTRPRQGDDVTMYAGLRLLRLGDHVADPDRWLRQAWEALGESPYYDDPDLLNHDVFLCRFEPCARCRRIVSETVGVR